MQRFKGFLKGNFRNVLFLSLLTGLFFLLFPLSNSFGRDVSFVWTANTDSPPVDGYRLYYKIGAPGSTLNDYNGTDANSTNPSPITISGQGSVSYTLRNLLDSEQYSFVLTAYRGLTESAPTSAIPLPPSSGPKANITADVLTGAGPLPVTFNATTSIGNIVNYQWMFGDGKTGSGSIVSHTFASVGNYTTTLKITDSQGAIDQSSVSIIVTNPSANNKPPSAVISSSSSVGPAPLSIEFDGSASSDTDGTILAYSWDFGDGGSGSGALANYTYSTAGTFNALLTVTDDGGLTDSISTPVQVSPSDGNNKRPTAVISASASKGSVPMTISFYAGHSYDTDGNIVSYTWNFGDGTIGSGKSVTHKFLQSAIYKVTLKVKDNNGANSLAANYTVTVVDTNREVNALPKRITQALMVIINLLLRQ